MALELFNKASLEVIHIIERTPLYSSKLLNYVERVNFKGKYKTKFYSEVNTNLQAGDKVYIINGSYDTKKLIQKNPLKLNGTGYTVLLVDNCSITLDIDFSGILPQVTDDFDSFIRVYTAKDQRELDAYSYINTLPITQYPGTTNSVGNYLDNNYNTLLYISTIGLTFGSSSGTLSATNSFYKKISGTWTDKGLEYITGSFSGLTATNGRLYIFGDSFSYSGVNFYERQIYTFSNNNWTIDPDYNTPYITKANFRGGSFSQSIWKDGVFGSYDRKSIWSGGTWNNGILLNSDWVSGTMLSKSDSSKSKIYYTVLNNGTPKQNIDTNNYFGNGLNFTVDSNFYNTTINNGNFERSLFIDNSNTYSTIENSVLSNTFSSNININKGKYSYSKLTNAVVLNSTVYNSHVSNSKLSISKFYDSYSKDSVVGGSEWNADGIQIVDYDVWNFINFDGLNSTVHRIYKFYISDADLLKMKNYDKFYIKDLIFSQINLDHKFSREFIINFFDNNNDLISTQLSTKMSNTYKVSTSYISGYMQNIFTTNTKNHASIDFIVDALGGGFANIYVNTDYTLISTDTDYISNWSSAKLLNSSFESGIFNGTWNSGNNKNQWTIERRKVGFFGSTTADYYIGITGSPPYDLSIQVAYTDDFRVPEIDQWLYIDGISYYDVTPATVSITGWYKVIGATPAFDVYNGSVINLTLADELLNITQSLALPGYPNENYEAKYWNIDNDIRYIAGYVSPTLFTGSTIRTGEIDRSYYYNTDFKTPALNRSIVQRTSNQLSVNKLKIGYNLFSPNNTTVITYSNPYVHSSYLDNQKNINGGTINLSILNDSIVSGATIKNVRWQVGTFSSGNFMDSNNKSAVVGANGNNITYTSPINVWYDGLFQSGQFLTSEMHGGTVTGGLLSNSFIKALSGDTFIYDATIGDKNIGLTQTIVSPNPTNIYFDAFNATHSIFLYRNKIENAVIGGATLMYDNTFNGGLVFGVGTNHHKAPTWYSGVFNKGQFVGNSLWIDGQFNGGLFNANGHSGNSGYGGTSSYGWLGGTFSGGIFGQGSFDFLTSDFGKGSWYDGVFTGGKFKGRVWRNGIFLGGEFEGFQTQSVVNDVDNFMWGYDPTVASLTQSGVWLDGIVSDSIKKASQLSVKSNNFEIEKIQSLNKDQIKFTNVLWVDGTFSNSLASMDNCVWLDGNFDDGQFLNSNFNPYVLRWDFDNFDISTTYSYAYNLSSSCVWNNGVLDNSLFSISEWNSGLFKSGTMSGARFNKGTANYITAVNTIWADGRWRNGNWLASDFIFSSASNIIIQPGLPKIQQTYMPYTTVGGFWGLTAGAMRDILTHQSIRNDVQSYHIWNVFTHSSGIDTYSGTYNNTEQVNLTYSDALATTNRGTYSVYGYSNSFRIATQSGISYSISTSSATGIVFAKIGNGNFIKGDWETGVWNNGLRLDTSFNGQERIQIFDSILNAYQTEHFKWVAILKGLTFSNINVGDSVTLGNIILIDINGRRKHYKDKAIVLISDTTNGLIGVEFSIKFPIRNIEVDSSYHKMYVTRKNWYNGVFLNGRFNGVWLDGFVKSYSKLAVFTQSHWVDGQFNGGAFYSYVSGNVYGTTSATYSTSLVQGGTFDGLYDSVTSTYKTWLQFNMGTVSGIENYYTSNPYKNIAAVSTNDVLEMSYIDEYINSYYSNDNILSYGVKYNLFDNFIPANQIYLDEHTSPPLNITDTDYYTDISNDYPTTNVTNQLKVYQNYSLGINDFGLTLNTFSSTVYDVGHSGKKNIGSFRYGVTIMSVKKLHNISTTGSITPFGATNSFGLSFFNDLSFAIDANQNFNGSYRFKHFDYNGFDTPLFSWSDLNPISNVIVKRVAYQEVDRIPFINIFYATSNYEYTVAALPFEANAPFIDFADNEYSFANSISFNFDTIIIPAKPFINPSPNPNTGGNIITF